MAETIYNDTFEYQPHRNIRRTPSVCHLQVARRGDDSLIIATELADNPGMSITNSSERLASLVVQQFGLNPAHMTFIEHYNEESYYGQSLRRDPDHYSEVSYTWEGNEAKHPQWKPLSFEAFVEVGIAFDVLLDPQDIDRPADLELAMDYDSEVRNSFLEEER